MTGAAIGGNRRHWNGHPLGRAAAPRGARRCHPRLGGAGPLRIYHDTRAALWAESTTAPPRHVMLIHLGRRPSIAWVLNGAGYLGTWHGRRPRGQRPHPALGGDRASRAFPTPSAPHSRRAGAGTQGGRVVDAGSSPADHAAARVRDRARRSGSGRRRGALALRCATSARSSSWRCPRASKVAPEIRFSSLDEFAVASGAASWRARPASPA